MMFNPINAISAIGKGLAHLLHGNFIIKYFNLIVINSHYIYIFSDRYDLYGVDEFGVVTGEFEMMSEIYARGPIACLLNSDSVSFNNYHGGIISCPKRSNNTDGHINPECNNPLTDHVIVILGWGIDKETGMKFWVGKNSYGTQWGEGSGGGWFRLERGSNTLNLESSRCAWAVPAKEDVERAINQFDESLAL